MELPYETYERIIGRQWPGGTSDQIKMLLTVFGIGYPAGSAEANVLLQYCLLHANPVVG